MEVLSMPNENAGCVKELTDQLEQGVRDFFESGKLKDYLNVMTRFNNYSVNNLILIAMQKPEATAVAGYTTWKNAFKRQVSKGEKGIKIFAPVPVKIKQLQDRLDEQGNKILSKNGDPEQEEVEITIPKFKVVNVFDISQTYGEEIPELITSLKGDVEQYQDFFIALEKTSPVPVGFEKIKGAAHGYYSHQDKRIAINEGESQIQTVKTLIHEIAHAKLHDRENGEPNKSRETWEVEAESVAYVVCKHFGIDTSDYSFGYVATWSSDKEIKELKDSMETIRLAARELICDIELNLRELQRERSLVQDDKQPKISVLYQLKSNQEKIKDFDGEKDKNIKQKEVER